MDKKDPLYHFMVAKGFYVEDDAFRADSTAVISFPMSAPAEAITRDQVPALKALDLWMLYQQEWCEHKPSITVSVGDDEWMEVGAWVFKNFDDVSGVSFLPRSDHSYQQAPYQDLTPQEYTEWLALHPQPDIDWTELAKFESTDNTVSAQTLACVSGLCDLPNT